MSPTRTLALCFFAALASCQDAAIPVTDAPGDATIAAPVDGSAADGVVGSGSCAGESESCLPTAVNPGAHCCVGFACNSTMGTCVAYSCTPSTAGTCSQDLTCCDARLTCLHQPLTATTSDFLHCCVANGAAPISPGGQSCCSGYALPGAGGTSKCHDPPSD